MFSCDQTRTGLACACDGDDGLVRAWHGAHVPGVWRAGLLRAGQQETVAVLHPTQLREPCDVGAGRRTRVRDDVQRVAAAGIRARVGGTVARSAGRGTRVLLPHVRAVSGVVRWRRWRRTRFRSATPWAGPASRRRSAGECRPGAGAPARSRPVEPGRREPAATGSRAGAAWLTGRPGSQVADSAARWKPRCDVVSGRRQRRYRADVSLGRRHEESTHRGEGHGRTAVLVARPFVRDAMPPASDLVAVRQHSCPALPGRRDRVIDLGRVTAKEVRQRRWQVLGRAADYRCQVVCLNRLVAVGAGSG
jgi:hypothetical protein